MGIESTEVLHQLDDLVLLGKRLSWFHHAQFLPFGDVFFYFLAVSVRYFELFDVDWVFSIQGNFVKQGVSLAQVKYVGADDVMVCEEDFQVLMSIRFWTVSWTVLVMNLLLSAVSR